MYKFINKTFLILFVLSTISCSDSLNSGIEAQSDVDFMEPVTSALMSLEGDETTGSGIFMLNWNGMKPRFSDAEEVKLGMAMAIGFESESTLKPPHNVSTVDMGTVTIHSADGETIELIKQKSRFSEEDLVYRSERFAPFQERSTLTFEAGGQYSVNTSGAGTFPSLDLKVTAPENKVSILSPTSERLQNHSGDLEITWDANPGKPVAVHIRPAIDPRSSEKPSPFNKEDSEIILLEDQNGSYTISGETFSEIAGNSDGNAVHISVDQMHLEDVVAEGRTYRVIMRTGDHRLVELD